MKRMSLKNIILFSLFTALSVNLRVFSFLIPIIFFLLLHKMFLFNETKFILKIFSLFSMFFYISFYFLAIFVEQSDL